MTFGLESSLPTPLASAAVIKKSTAKLGDRCASSRPLVGTPAPKLVTKGITGGVVLAMVTGAGGLVPPKVLWPTVESPPIISRPFSAVPANASCVPIYYRSEEHTSELQSRLHLVCR